MFQFRGFAHLAVWYIFNVPGCPIQKSADQFVFANPRSLSQLITSFFASKSQGILHAPLFTFYLLTNLIVVRFYRTNLIVDKNNLFKDLLIKSLSVMSPLYPAIIMDLVSLSICQRTLSSFCSVETTWTKPVENIGVEPMTSCVQGRRSSQLS